MKLSSLLASLLVLSACAPIYTPETTWTYDDPKTDDDFRPDLTECVQYFDRAHLDEMNDGGEYQVSGFFIDTARTQAGCQLHGSEGLERRGSGMVSRAQAITPLFMVLATEPSSVSCPQRFERSFAGA